MSDKPHQIVNTWEQLQAAVADGIIPKKQALSIGYTAPHGMSPYSGVHVWSPFFHTDTEAAWHDNKRKRFFGRKLEAIEAAKAWVAETYGYIGKWVGNAMRDQVPEVVQKKYPIKRRKKLDVPAAS